MQIRDLEIVEIRDIKIRDVEIVEIRHVEKYRFWSWNMVIHAVLLALGIVVGLFLFYL